ncbi:MAG: MoaD/ThiS family protein [bacterium]|nr:MoaD/ThiS family protein [bacterium]
MSGPNSSVDNISIEVLLFAGASELAGARSIVLSLAAGTTVAELRENLIHQYPALEPLATVSRWAVGEIFVDDTHCLKNSDRVAMIPPVSGG